MSSRQRSRSRDRDRDRDRDRSDRNRSRDRRGSTSNGNGYGGSVRNEPYPTSATRRDSYGDRGSSRQDDRYGGDYNNGGGRGDTSRQSYGDNLYQSSSRSRSYDSYESSSYGSGRADADRRDSGYAPRASSRDRGADRRGSGGYASRESSRDRGNGGNGSYGYSNGGGAHGYSNGNGNAHAGAGGYGGGGYGGSGGLGVHRPSHNPPPPPAPSWPVPADQFVIGEFTQGDSNLKINKLVLAKRPDRGGSNGVTVTAKANYLKMDVGGFRDIYQYDVIVKSINRTGNVREKPSTNRAVNREVFEVWQRQEQGGGGVLTNVQNGAINVAQAWCLYDGMKILYCNGDINLGGEDVSRTFVVRGVVEEGSDTPSDFTFTIKQTGTLYAVTLIEFYNHVRDPHHFPAPVVTPSADILAALEFLIRQYASTSGSGIVSVNRSFFLPETKTAVQKSVLDMMKGVYGSVRYVKEDPGVAINVDMSHGVFYPKGPLLPTITQFLQLQAKPSTLNDAQKRLISHKFRNVLFSVNHRGQVRGRYRFSGLTKDDSQNVTFEDSGGNRVSVYDYFAATHNMQLQYPRLPLIEVRTGGATGKGRIAYFPLETAEILPNQRFMGRVNEDETTSLVQFASALPPEKERDISKIHAKMRLSAQQNQYLRAYGVDIDADMINVEARRLETPRLAYHNKASGSVAIADPLNKGFWSLPVGGQFISPGTLRDIKIVVFADKRTISITNDPGDAEENIAKFTNQLLRLSEEYGVAIPQEITIPSPVYFDHSTNFSNDLVGVCRNAQPNTLVLIILPTDNAKNPVYTEIKRITDTVVGIPSQCVKPKWVRGMDKSAGGGGPGGRGGGPMRGGGRGGGRGGFTKRTDRSLFTQLVLKVNVKLGGLNTMIDGPLPIVDNEPSMILGVDSTHPPPGSHSQSIASAVASMNRTCTLYYASTALILPRADTIDVLDQIVHDQLKLFQLSNSNALPQKIIVYRDGISEGQFQKVLDAEVGRIKSAARRISVDRIKNGLVEYDPKITFIVTQKRHHSRFFFGRDNTDNKGNALPGTVVDTGIVHPDHFEFYLYSHPGLQGTSRPTKYQVLYDENKLTSDDFQRLTYHLCHLYARSMRAVSLPPPVYYAHLVADRARSYVRDDSDAGSMSSGSAGGSRFEDQSITKVKDELRTSGLWFI